MAALLETPSRVWRRIQAVEGQDMPSLPEVPAFEDSADADPSSSRLLPQESDDTTDDDDLLHTIPSTRHSTPGASQYGSTVRPFGSAHSTPRFVNSFGSRKSFVASPGFGFRASPRDSLGTNKVSPNPRIDLAVDADDDDISGHDLGQESKSSVPDVYLPPPDDEDEDDISISDALQSVSRASSPAPFASDAFDEDESPKEDNDLSGSVKFEVNVCFRPPFVYTSVFVDSKYLPLSVLRLIDSKMSPSVELGDPKILYQRNRKETPLTALPLKRGNRLSLLIVPLPLTPSDQGVSHFLPLDL